MTLDEARTSLTGQNVPKLLVRFEALVEWSEESLGFVGEASELEGVLWGLEDMMEADQGGDSEDDSDMDGCEREQARREGWLEDGIEEMDEPCGWG